MGKIISLVMIASFVFVNAGYAAERKRHEPLPILFVDSEKTFQEAQKSNWHTRQGLCVSMKFYDKVSHQRQIALKNLIQDALHIDFFAACLYDVPFDQGLSALLFDGEDGSRCRPPAYVIAYRIKNKKDEDVHIYACGMDTISSGNSLIKFRIEQDLQKIRDEWQKQGYRVK